MAITRAELDQMDIADPRWSAPKWRIVALIRIEENQIEVGTGTLYLSEEEALAECKWLNRQYPGPDISHYIEAVA